MKNRIAGFFNTGDFNTPPNETEIQKIERLTAKYLQALDGINPANFYSHIAKAIVGICATTSHKGAEQFVLDSFKHMLDKRLKQFLEGNDNNLEGGQCVG